MKSATIHELKQELQNLPAKELVALCLRLGRFKKENKELLTYLLYEAHDEEGFVRGIKTEIDELFETVNLSQLFFAKKTLRKIARIINKYCRYSGNKTSELELRLHFCTKLNQLDIDINRNAVIANLYAGQVKKVMTLLAGLHEDLQYDYKKAVDGLELPAKVSKGKWWK